MLTTRTSPPFLYSGYNPPMWTPKKTDHNSSKSISAEFLLHDGRQFAPQLRIAKQQINSAFLILKTPAGSAARSCDKHSHSLLIINHHAGLAVAFHIQMRQRCPKASKSTGEIVIAKDGSRCIRCAVTAPPLFRRLFVGCRLINRFPVSTVDGYKEGAG